VAQSLESLDVPVGLPEEIALHVLNAAFADELEAFLGGHHSGDAFDAKFAAQADQGLEKGLTLRAF